MKGFILAGIRTHPSFVKLMKVKQAFMMQIMAEQYPLYCKKEVEYILQQFFIAVSPEKSLDESLNILITNSLGHRDLLRNVFFLLRFSHMKIAGYSFFK
jgi:hypothetical protein